MGKTRRVPVVVVHGLDDLEAAPGIRPGARATVGAGSLPVKVALLSGGTGGARLASGLAAVMPPEDLSIVANTADDEEFWGLLVCPDVDAILYRLAGVFNEATGFGVRDDTFHAQAMLGSLGEQTWFQLGDRDIGVHLLRAMLLRSGLRLSEAVAHLARGFGIQRERDPDERRPGAHPDPDRCRGIEHAGVVRRGAVRAGSARHPARRHRVRARPRPRQSLRSATRDAVIIGPSNPLLSVDPDPGGARRRARPRAGHRGLPGRRRPLVEGPDRRHAPRQMGEEATALGVARRYAGIAATIVIDRVDVGLLEPIRSLGMHTLVDDTVMDGPDGERRFAHSLLHALELARWLMKLSLDFVRANPHGRARHLSPRRTGATLAGTRSRRRRRSRGDQHA